MTVNVSGLAVTRRGRAVLHAVDLDLPAGTSCAVVGPNGAGKSTLLLALAGVLSPAAGAIRVDGVDPSAGRRQATARHVSLMPQHLECPFAFTALEVVLMGKAAERGPFGSPSPTEVEAAHAALRDLGVDALADRPMTRLSGGERQRVHFAMQLVQGAKVLLLDEPTSAMDFAGTQAVLEQVEALCARGHTIVAALHDLNVASVGFAQTLLLESGRVRDRGRTADVLDGQAIADAYDGAFERHVTDAGVFIVPRRGAVRNANG